MIDYVGSGDSKGVRLAVGRKPKHGLRITSLRNLQALNIRAVQSIHNAYSSNPRRFFDKDEAVAATWALVEKDVLRPFPTDAGEEPEETNMATKPAGKGTDTATGKTPEGKPTGAGKTSGKIETDPKLNDTNAPSQEDPAPNQNQAQTAKAMKQADKDAKTAAKADAAKVKADEKARKAAEKAATKRKPGEETPTVTKIVKLLQRKEGATKKQIIEAVPEAQPGYVAALLTRIFKEKGYTIEPEVIENSREKTYRITGVPKAE